MVLLAGVTAAIVAWIATWGAERLGRWLAVVDVSGGYKQHGAPVPLLGGVGVAAGWLVAVINLAGTDVGRLAAVALGALIIVTAGMLDDIRGLAPGHKLAWQAGAAAAAGSCLAALGVHLDLFLQWPPLPVMLLTALWVVFIVNALNFVDNTNGLCAGIGAIAAGALAVVNTQQGEPEVALGAAALSGACIGFLPHNWPRARVFLGDTGSMFIGFVLAALAVMGVYTRGGGIPRLAVLAPVCILAVPMLDAVLVVLLRLRIRHPPWLGDRRHLSHRLVQRGLRSVTAVVLLWIASAAAAVIGVLLPMADMAQASLLLGLLFFLLVGLTVAAGTRGLP
jgi:UDP-GlcNAc:undecaprenyl-phosphate GlcNAc-1-phosphate transferase